jgi:hypothetical protein
MAKLSLAELEKRIRALPVGVQLRVVCNRGEILVVEKQTEHDKLLVGGEYHAWKPCTSDGSIYTYTGDMEGLMALIAQLRKRQKKA